MKKIKRPKLENLDHHQCSDSCYDKEWPCHCEEGYDKAVRNNKAVQQAKELGVINQIEEITYGTWLINNSWYYHPNSRKGRPKGRFSKYQKFFSFASFYKKTQLTNAQSPKKLALVNQ